MARITIGQAMLESRPHVLYRFYDRTDVLLYIGITADLAARMATHEREKDWWPRVDRAATRIEYYDCRSAALAAERDAIKAEQPLHNDQHNEFVQYDGLPGLMRDTEVAQLITDEVITVLGTYEVRIAEAHIFTAEQSLLPEDERLYGPSISDPVVTALHLIETIASDVHRLRAAARMVLEAVPEEMRQMAENETAADYWKADEPEAPWEERIADIVRHLSYVLADEYQRDRPRLRNLRSVA